MENSAWQSGNGFYSSQALFSEAFNTCFPNNTQNLPIFGMNFGTQNTQGPPVFSVYMIIGVIKIVEQCSDIL